MYLAVKKTSWESMGSIGSFPIEESHNTNMCCTVWSPSFHVYSYCTRSLQKPYKVNVLSQSWFTGDTGVREAVICWWSQAHSQNSGIDNSLSHTLRILMEGTYSALMEATPSRSGHGSNHSRTFSAQHSWRADLHVLSWWTSFPFLCSLYLFPA